MASLTHHELTMFFLAIGILLACARGLGELASRYRQPAVLGEILAGILLGPTVFGTLAPEWSAALFPSEGGFPIAMDGITALAIALFLLVAGMEVDLSTVFRQGIAALSVGFVGMTVPFAVGFSSGWFLPELFGAEPSSDRLVFAMFLGTALSISALPVIIKTLIDLNLFRSDIGMLIVASAILLDLVGWNLFALVLGLAGADKGGPGIGQTIGLTVLFVILMLTVGRWLIDLTLPWVQAHTSYPGGVLGFCLTGALLSSAFTEWVGIHAIFGAFIFGVAFGDSRHLRMQTRTTLEQFISFIFAPLFFASIGLKVNFIERFDILLVVLVLFISTVGMVVGARTGARMAGVPPRESWAVGFGMNARGAMEIILGLLALKAGIIGERLFVALVVMALVTSMTSGTALQWLLQRRRSKRFTDHLSSRGYIKALAATDRLGAIQELARAACEGTSLKHEVVAESAWQREQIASTGLTHGLAVPHARIEGILTPIIAVGVAKKGVDFDSLDGKPAQLIFLIVTPKSDMQAQLDMLADIGHTFQKPDFVERVLKSAGYTEFLALIKSEGPAPRDGGH